MESKGLHHLRDHRGAGVGEAVGTRRAADQEVQTGNQSSTPGTRPQDPKLSPLSRLHESTPPSLLLTPHLPVMANFLLALRHSTLGMSCNYLQSLAIIVPYFFFLLKKKIFF